MSARKEQQWWPGAYEGDTEYDEWNPGDTLVWDDDSECEGPVVITRMWKQEQYVFWETPEGEERMTRSSNMIRIKAGVLSIIDNRWPRNG